MDRKGSTSPLHYGIVALLALLIAATAPAQVPQLINYQGYVTDDGGSPLNGVQSITFSIYNSATAGNEVWSETQNVMVTNGLFTALMGTTNLIPYTVFDSGERYLAVRIGGAPELAPRQRLVSIGYCFNAHEAERLGGRTATEFVRSVEGVAPQNGNIDLVAGSNVTISTNAPAHSITISSSALTLPFSSTVSSSQTALTVLNNGTGYALAASSNTYGVRATSSGVDGYAVYGVANGENARAIVGSTTGANGYGVWGFSSSHYGVYGSSSTGTGVYGKQLHDGDYGFLGGQGFGAYGEHHATGNVGFLANGSYGVYGENPQEETSGALGGLEGARGVSREGFGVLGASTNSDGVRGHSDNGFGVHGISEEASAALAGVYGVGTKSAAGVMGTSDAGRGVHGKSNHGAAVYAEGDLEVTGAYKGNIRSASATDGAPFPRPAFDSGWVTMAAASAQTIEHHIGGDPDDYFIDMWTRSDASGRQNRGVGGDVGRSNNYGASWRQLTNNSVEVVRLADDVVAEQIRIRIWLIR